MEAGPVLLSPAASLHTLVSGYPLFILGGNEDPPSAVQTVLHLLVCVPGRPVSKTLKSESPSIQF